MGTTVTDPLVGRLVDGRYEVVSRIARGGMATVYLAVDRRLDRDVALKVMHPHLAEGAGGADFEARFRREARAAARLTHPGLVAVFDQGVDGETSYLTMEYVDGGNLRRRLGEQGALTVDDALRTTDAVLDALATAHRAGLVHRDIKPENVLLANDDRVKLADFGLARAVTEVTSTTTGTVLGTVAYLAPELVVRGANDARTDVYACGVLLYEMLTGAQPFTGETPIQVAFQHVNSDIPAPSDSVGWLPVEIDDLVRALAAREPDDRPVDATAALALLRRTRAELDPATLARRADVAPTIVLPAATDPDETDLSGEHEALVGATVATAGPVHDGGTLPTETIAAPGSHDAAGDAARPGATVAVPIGLGLAAPLGPPPPPPTRTHRGRRWLAALVATVALAAGGVWWWGAYGPGAWTTVPVVVGSTLEDARATLTAAGLDTTTARAYDAEVPEGSIVSSEPAQGERVSKDGSVEVVVSQGPEYVAVPKGVVGELQADAEAALAKAGLEVDYGPAAWHDTAGLGVVLSATLPDGGPADPGASTVKGSTVTLVVSKGPEPVTITSVVGATVADAKKQLGDIGIKVKTFGKFSDKVAEGRVISQDPKAGSGGHRGDVVRLVVSKGPQMVALPDFYGVNVADAERELKALGFKVVVNEPQGISPFNMVYRQTPGGGDGKTAPKGSTITLDIF